MSVGGIGRLKPDFNPPGQGTRRTCAYCGREAWLGDRECRGCGAPVPVVSDVDRMVRDGLTTRDARGTNGTGAK